MLPELVSPTVEHVKFILKLKIISENYGDQDTLTCKPCADGCLDCINDTLCKTCLPEFELKPDG